MAGSFARNLIVRLGADVEPLQKELKKAEKELATAKKNMSEQIDGLKSTVGKMAIGAGVVAGGLAAITKTAIDNADTIQKNADIYGMTAERVQELTYAGTKLDVEFETIAAAQSKLTKAMYAAKDGTGEQAKAFKELGISVVDGKGNLLDSKTVMGKVFDALGKMGNETERDALAMKIFGKSAMELNPLIKAGSTELNRLTEEAHKNGAVLSNDTVSALDKTGDSMEALKQTGMTLVGKLAEKLQPALDKLVNLVTNADFTPIVNGFQWVIDNAESVGYAIGIIAGALITVKTTLAIIAVSDAFTKLAATMTAANIPAVLAPTLATLAAVASYAVIAIEIVIIANQVNDLVKQLGGWQRTFEVAAAAWGNSFIKVGNGIIGVINTIRKAFGMSEFQKLNYNYVTSSFDENVKNAKGIWGEELAPSMTKDKNGVWSVPKRAAGGLAYAPQLAIVGDNKNAQYDPEVISPLSKLKGYMQDMGGGGNTVLEIDGVRFGKINKRIGQREQRISGNPRMV